MNKRMLSKKYLLVMIVTIGLLGPAMAVEPEPAETPTPTPVKGGCNLSAWNTEVYRFYGGRDPIIKSLSKLPAEILKRRVFIQVTQGDPGAEIKLYERQANGEFTVTQWNPEITQWKPEQTSHLLAEIDKAILANKGVNCVGEQVVSVLSKELGKGRVLDNIAPPVSTKAAFSHSIRDAKGDFLETDVVVLC